MRPFPGEFYFNLTSYGNLLGEFTNRSEAGMCTESSVRETGEQAAGVYTGKYQTTWFDSESKQAVYAVLTIDPEHGKAAGRHELIWTDPKKKEIQFHGYGFVCNGMLIGHYSDGAKKE
ncbi:MAG: hypothetical protein V4672_00085 [Verrucomicrobiota bacterium]